MSQHSRLEYDLCNPIIIPPTQFFAKPSKLILGEFTCNRAPALIGVDLATGAKMWCANANLLDLPANDGCVWIDNNGVNEGLLDELVRKNVIEFNNRFAHINAGYVFECKLMI